MPPASVRPAGRGISVTQSPPLPIIDADGHVVEPEETWMRFLEPRFHELVPRPVRDGDGVFPGAATELLESEALDDDARERSLFRNAVRFYGL